MGTICAAHHLEDRRASPEAANRMLGTGGSYMHRWLLGMSLVAAISVGALCGAREASASKPFTPLVKMKCTKCHTTPKGSEKDLTDCGKAAQEYLTKQGYKKGEWDKIKGFTYDK
jgi:hypothetical protein